MLVFGCCYSVKKRHLVRWWVEPEQIIRLNCFWRFVGKARYSRNITKEVCVCVCMSVHSCPCSVSTTGINLKILIVDIRKKDVLPPVHIRAEQEWIVSQLKTAIGKVKSSNVFVMSLHTFSLSLSRFAPWTHQ